MSMIRILCSVALCLCLSESIAAKVLDTLSYYQPDGKFVYYWDPQIVMHAARFVPAGPGSVKSIRIMLGGANAAGSATLHIYGHEGGGVAPQLQKDLIPPILVRKTRPGAEMITVVLKEDVPIENDQFFIGIDNISEGVTLLSDHSRKIPACSSPSDQFYYQFLKLQNQRWRWGVYTYVIDVVMEYPEATRQGYLVDITADAGLPDSNLANRSLAWADVDEDGYLDLLAGGRLYRNNQGRRFDDVTHAARLSGVPLANIFADINNDQYIDLIFLGSADSSRPQSALFINNGDGTFAYRALPVPPLATPTSLNVADINGDGFLDIFIGQRGSSVSNLLLVNNRDLSFSDRSGWLHREDSASPDVLGSQWIDFDNDGRLDLFIANKNSSSELWRSLGDSTFVRIAGPALPGNHGGLAEGWGCDWADYDNDGDLDLLLPKSVGIGTAMTLADAGATVYINSGAPNYELKAAPGDIGIQYEEKHTGGAWGDVNNDGMADVVTTTSCPCRYADIYIQQPDGRFLLRTSEYGMQRMAAGNDAIWVDIDNDGRLDLATIDDGRIRLLKNNGPFDRKNYLELDLMPSSGCTGGVGASVTVYTGGDRYTQQVTAGRGILMAKPFRLHFGLDDASSIDSVAIRWPNSTNVEIIRDIAANKLHRLGRNNARRTAAQGVTVEAAPNPFSTNLAITYTLPSERTVRLAIYSVDGGRVITLVDGVQPAGTHSVTWDARDQSGERVSKGTYIYHLISDDADLMGRVVLIR